MVKFVVLAPLPKFESMSHLTYEQRYSIAQLRQQQYKLKDIGTIIGKHKSVISRELKRNCDCRNGVYKADLAQQKCATRHKQKLKHTYFTNSVKEYVELNIKNDFSPEQVSGTAKLTATDCVSHERIYQHIWADKKKGGTLYTHLRCKGKKYVSRGLTNKKRGQIIGRVDIDQRPAIVEEKNRFGDFETDLIIGKNHNQAIFTANDRSTGLLRMGKVNSKEAKEIENVAIDLLGEFTSILHTITSDNGKEFANHQAIAKALEIDYYFAKPYHSWERGANENLNGLIRQYFPKGSDFTKITAEQIKYVEDKLNNRPRKRFGYLTPNQVYLTTLTNGGKVAFMT
jgi:transposase, IS30 family